MSGPRTLVIAHRTSPFDAPENSREGVAHAAAMGADAVEVDVRLSRDGVPVLVHDPLTLRTTGWPLVVAWTSARRLTSLRLRHTDETLPAFADVLATLPDGLDLAVDVKDGAAMTAAIDALRAAGCLARAKLWSSHAGAVEVAVHRAPAEERAWLQNTHTEADALAYARDAVTEGATAISVMDVSLTPAVVACGHDLGLTVHSWVRSLAIQDRVLACQPDGVVTDWPVQARRRLDAG